MRKQIFILALIGFLVLPFSVHALAQTASEKTDAAKEPAQVTDAQKTVIQPSENVKTETPPASTIQTEPASAPAVKTEAPSAPTVNIQKESTAQLNPGLYNFEETGIEFTEEDDGFEGTGVLKLQLDLKSDSTFTMTTYVTCDTAELKDQIIAKTRGNWKQDADKLITSNILEQSFNFDTKTFSPWESPEDGQSSETVKIQNVTSGTFQEYDEDSKTWMTWIKL